MKLRPYQEDLSNKASKILKILKIVGLYMEVRTGKTITALATIKKYGAKNALFLTKKKAISSIESDYKHYKDDFDLTVINYESVHKVSGKFDCIILDESHGLVSGFPKPSKTWKEIKKRFSKLPMILLSGTPLIESASKAYPQFGISDYSPFRQYSNFYKWARDYVKIKQIRTSYGLANDYSNANYNKIIKVIGPYILNFTQKEAGFTTEIQEEFIEVEMKQSTYDLVKKIIKDRVIEGKEDAILADTGVKLQIVLHQLYSGTIKLESGKAITIDNTKAEFIKKQYGNKKLAIMYNFIQEGLLLEEIFGDKITRDLEVFNNTDKHYLGQIISTREGVSLKAADLLIFYNIPFSGTSYVQGRDRCSHKDREENKVLIIGARGGIENKIYKVVKKKQNFTNKIFKKDFNI